MDCFLDVLPDFLSIYFLVYINTSEFIFFLDSDPFINWSINCAHYLSQFALCSCDKNHGHIYVARYTYVSNNNK